MRRRSHASVLGEVVLGFVLLLLFVGLMLGSVFVLLRMHLFGIAVAPPVRYVAWSVLAAGTAVVVYVVRTGRWVRAELPPKEHA